MKRVIVGLLVLVAAAVAAVVIYINEIVGSAIERGGTYALGVDTRVGFVRLRLLDGSLRLSSLRIANPPGFDEDHFLRVGSAALEVSLDTLRDDVVVVPLFRIDRIDVALEREGRQTNYGAILNNLKRFESGEAPEQPEPAAGKGSERRFIVNRLAITDLSAHVEWSQLAAEQSAVEVAIPRIELENIGAHNAEGVVVSELTSIIMKAILGAVARYGGDLPRVMLGELRSGLGGLERVPGVVVTGMGANVAEAVGEAVGGEVGDAIRGVGGSAVKSVGEAVGGEASRALGGLLKKRSGNPE